MQIKPPDIKKRNRGFYDLVFRAAGVANGFLGIGLAFPFFVEAVLSSVLFDSAGCVDELLLAREKGMAVRADFHVNVADGGSGLERVAAGAGHLGQFV
jgi:hypothetical protein